MASTTTKAGELLSLMSACRSAVTPIGDILGRGRFVC